MSPFILTILYINIAGRAILAMILPAPENNWDSRRQYQVIFRTEQSARPSKCRVGFKSAIHHTNYSLEIFVPSVRPTGTAKLNSAAPGGENGSNDSIYCK